MYKSLYQKTLLVLLMILFSLSAVKAQTQRPVAQKIQVLRALYQEKKADGYDVQAVEQSMAALQQARQKGDKETFLKLLKTIETQLAQAEMIEPPADLQTSPPLRRNVSLADSPWPMYGHDRRHTCRSPYRGVTDPPSGPAWTFAAPGGHGIASPLAIGPGGNGYLGTWKSSDYATSKTKGHSGLLCALSSNGQLAWTHNSNRGSLLASGIESTPLITADGKIIYGKDDGYVYALSPGGNQVWTFACDDVFDPDNPYDDNEQVIPSPVLGPNGILYICSHWGNVYNPLVIKELRKTTPLMDQFDITPVKKPPWGKVYAIDPENGERLWVYDPSAEGTPTPKSILGSPAVGDDGTLYVGMYDATDHGYLYALDPHGKLKWRLSRTDTGPLSGLCGAPSIADDGTIYIGSFGGKRQASIYAVNPDGTLKWDYRVAENRITAAPGIGPDGTIYVGTHNWGFIASPQMSRQGHLYALRDEGDKAALKWRFAVNYGILTPPAIDRDGNIFIGTNGDPKIIGQQGPCQLVVLNAKGEKRWSYDLDGRIYSHPVIDSDGSVYVGTTRGQATLYAFKPTD